MSLLMTTLQPLIVGPQLVNYSPCTLFSIGDILGWLENYLVADVVWESAHARIITHGRRIMAGKSGHK